MKEGVCAVNNNETDQFRFLGAAALEHGVADARIIPADEIVVEDRVRLKCRTGCHGFGKSLTCPPYAPTVDDFRQSLGDYQYALLIKFRSKAEFGDENRCSLVRDMFDPAAPKERKESAAAFLGAMTLESRKLHHIMLDLERAAFNAGYTFALAMTCGSCKLCESCNIKGGECIHPTMSRFSPESLGINVKKTMEHAGMAIRFPAPQNPERIAILLID